MCKINKRIAAAHYNNHYGIQQSSLLKVVKERGDFACVGVISHVTNLRLFWKFRICFIDPIFLQRGMREAVKYCIYGRWENRLERTPLPRCYMWTSARPTLESCCSTVSMTSSSVWSAKSMRESWLKWNSNVSG